MIGEVIIGDLVFKGHLINWYIVVFCLLMLVHIIYLKFKKNVSKPQEMYRNYFAYLIWLPSFISNLITLIVGNWGGTISLWGFLVGWGSLYMYYREICVLKNIEIEFRIINTLGYLPIIIIHGAITLSKIFDSIWLIIFFTSLITTASMYISYKVYKVSKENRKINEE